MVPLAATHAARHRHPDTAQLDTEHRDTERRRAAPIRLQNLTRRFAPDSPPALDAVSIDIAPGAFTVLLGPSGCGKTTLLRIVAGLESAGFGAHVHIGDRDVTAPSARIARGLAMVFQSYALFPHLIRRREHPLRPPRPPGPAAPERTRRLAAAAAMLGLEPPPRAQAPRQLSGGQQQRVALGRAVVAEAPVCLMDEPLSNLDAQLRAEMRREILALQRRLGITMLYVTHDQTEAMGMADQVVLLRAGPRRAGRAAGPASMPRLRPPSPPPSSGSRP